MIRGKPEHFNAFIERVAKANAGDHIKAKASRVRHEDDFASLQQHILQMYDGVQVRHSLTDTSGAVFDCVPIEQQASLRGIGSAGLMRPPPLPLSPGSDEPIRLAEHTHGNICRGPEGTIPIRRLTLEQLRRFGNIGRVFKKSPGDGNPIPPSWGIETPTTDANPLFFGDVTHNYAHASQKVDNVGGHSALNVWSPPINLIPDPNNEIFALSQQWYISVSSQNIVQTFEVGSQCYPALYGTQQPVLFIGFTPNNYGLFVYNLFGPQFVQVSNSWAIGGTLRPQSSANGPQYELDVHVQYFYGNGSNPAWWLYLGTPGFAPVAVGYYPSSIFVGYNIGTGLLADGKANIIDYGGETAAEYWWPPMGSGQFASTGYQHAAYHKNVYYYPYVGLATDTNSSTPAALVPEAPTQGMYTNSYHLYSAPWNTSFFFGGPGGNGTVHLNGVFPADTLTPTRRWLVTTSLSNFRSGATFVAFIDGAQLTDARGISAPVGFHLLSQFVTANYITFDIGGIVNTIPGGLHTITVQHQHYPQVSDSTTFTVTAPTKGVNVTTPGTPRLDDFSSLNVNSTWHIYGTLFGYSTAPSLEYREAEYINGFDNRTVGGSGVCAWDATDQVNMIIGSSATGGTASVQPNGQGGVRATRSIAAGAKVYFEIVVGGIPTVLLDLSVYALTASAVGIATKSFTLGGTGAGASLVSWLGDTYVNGSQVRSADTYPSPTMIGTLFFAVDRVLNRMWWKSSHLPYWNYTAGDNPITGVGGYDISSLGNGLLYPVISSPSVPPFKQLYVVKGSGGIGDGFRGSILPGYVTLTGATADPWIPFTATSSTAFSVVGANFPEGLSTTFGPRYYQVRDVNDHNSIGTTGPFLLSGVGTNP